MHMSYYAYESDVELIPVELIIGGAKTHYFLS